jgi:hypothetical protein
VLLFSTLEVFLYTIISTLIFFLLVVFSTLLYFRLKKQNLAKLHLGICPNCDAKPKEFTNPTSGEKFKIYPIESKLLKSGGCSGVSDIQYKCKECRFEQVHQEFMGSC